MNIRILLFLIISFYSGLVFSRWSDTTYPTQSEAYSACQSALTSGWFKYGISISCQLQSSSNRYYSEGPNRYAYYRYVCSDGYVNQNGVCTSVLPSCSSLICADVPQQCKNETNDTVTIPACSQPTQSDCLTKPDGTISCKLDIDNEGLEIQIKPPELIDPNDGQCVGVLRTGGGVDNVKQVCPGTDPDVNCGYVNGQYICLKNAGTTTNPTNPNWLTDPNGNCFARPDASIFCLEGKSGVKINSNTTTTDNGDGTSTQVTHTTSNVSNYSNFTVTKTINNGTGEVISETVQGDAGRTDNSDVVKAVSDVNKTLTDLKESFNDPGATSDGVSTDNYTAGDKTFTTVLETFNNRLNNSPLGSATANVFSINVNGGQCPVWSTPAVSGSFFTFPSVVIDAQCSQTMNDIWPIISAVLIAVASFLALRIALL